jgi:hypothetical protein
MGSKPRLQVDISARCACGAVTIALKGRVYSMFMCACEDCQKATGTGHATVAIADPAEVSISGKVRGFARQAASGATFTRYFCPSCGTPLYGGTDRAPDAMMLPVGFFAGQNDWFVPNQLIFERSHRGWDLIADHLPRHETYRNQGVI